MSDNFPFHLFLNLEQEAKNTPSLSKNTENSPLVTKTEEKEIPSVNKKTFIDELKKITPPNIFDSFFKENIEKISAESEEIEITLSSDFVLKIIETTYKNYLKTTIKNITGKELSIKLKAQGAPTSSNKERPSSYLTPNLGQNIELIPSNDDLEKTVESAVINHFEEIIPGRASEGKKTFENFVVGPTNKVAYSMAYSVAKKPGKSYPLLFVYGPPGNGKSHILYSISNKIKELHPRLITHLTTTRHFMNEVMDAKKGNSYIDFRNRYLRSYDVIIFDDIHFLKNRPGTQNELEHILKEFHGKGKQLVFSSLYPPQEIEGLNPQIQGHLSWGLVLDITPPDRDHKIQILEKKASEEDIFIPKDIIVYLVDNLKGNMRDLEGALIRLGAMSSVKEIDIDLEMAKEHLAIHNASRDKSGPDYILEIVSDFYKIPIPDIKSQVRKKNVAKARHIAMYLCHKYLKRTYAEVGSIFNGRDHSTALYSIEKIKKELTQNVELKNQLFDIEKLINSTQ